MDSDNQQIVDPFPEEKVIYLHEHESFGIEYMRYIASLNLDFKETDYEGEPKYLGITSDLRASYYIGADWLTADKAVVVLPKMQDIDYVVMFMCPISGLFLKVLWN